MLIVKSLIKKISKELQKQNKKAHCYVPIESPSNKAFKSIGYSGKEDFLEHYRQNNLSGKVLRYDFP